MKQTKQEIDLNNWNRKEHYAFFSQFQEPFFGVIVNLDCSQAYQNAKQCQRSFYLYYLYRAVKAANAVKEFRYRVHDTRVYCYDEIHASCTVDRLDHTFGFSYIGYHENELQFVENAKAVTQEVRESKSLFPSDTAENVLHISAVPWINFTSISHARSYNVPDSCPKISFGKMTEQVGKMIMPVSIHVHHGLMDGYHVGLFIEKFQKLLNEV
jgi:chloramphenicol O-acetyltransferase type A